MRGDKGNLLFPADTAMAERQVASSGDYK